MTLSGCPCHSGTPFEHCCGPLLSGECRAASPKVLMRSRYAAFCIRDAAYLVDTCHPSTRKPDDRAQILKSFGTMQWIGLMILETRTDPKAPHIGYVEFAAFYRADPPGQLHERSRFIFENGQWYYLDGKILPPVVVKRNQPCWCGSLKKYKRCHGR